MAPSKKEKEYFVPCIKKPDLFEVAKWVEEYKDAKAKEAEIAKAEGDYTKDPEGNIWLLSMQLQMNRVTSADIEIPMPWRNRLGISIRIPLPDTPWIPTQTLKFETPLTPQWDWSIKQFREQMKPGGILEQCLAKFQPINVLYINHIQVLHRGPLITSGKTVEAFSIAHFGKTQKVRNPTARIELNDALVGRCIMPVDLDHINTFVVAKTRRRGKISYTKGTVVGRGHLYRDKVNARVILPNLINAGFLWVRTCEGKIESHSQFRSKSCGIEPF